MILLEEIALALMKRIDEQVRWSDAEGLQTATKNCTDCNARTIADDFCAPCLAKGLAYIVGTREAQGYLNTSIELMRRKRKILDLSRGTNDGNATQPDEPMAHCDS